MTAVDGRSSIVSMAGLPAQDVLVKYWALRPSPARIAGRTVSKRRPRQERDQQPAQASIQRRGCPVHQDDMRCVTFNAFSRLWRALQPADQQLALVDHLRRQVIVQVDEQLLTSPGDFVPRNPLTPSLAGTPAIPAPRPSLARCAHSRNRFLHATSPRGPLSRLWRALQPADQQLALVDHLRRQVIVQVDEQLLTSPGDFVPRNPLTPSLAGTPAIPAPRRWLARCAHSRNRFLHATSPRRPLSRLWRALQPADQQLALVDHLRRQVIVQVDEQLLVLDHLAAPLRRVDALQLVELLPAMSRPRQSMSS